MSRKFKIVIADAEWVVADTGYRLRASVADFGTVSRLARGKIYARAYNGRDDGEYLKSMSAAKRYVIKQLATPTAIASPAGGEGQQ